MKTIFEVLLSLDEKEKIDLMVGYDDYIYNEGEPWDEDRQPIGLMEYYDNEYLPLQGKYYNIIETASQQN